MAPQILDGYVLGKVIGQGTVGTIYHATSQESGQEFALKLLTPQISIEPIVERRFVREIAILQRLEHQNIVRYYDCGLHERGLYCVMEFVRFGSLKEAITRRGKFTWRQAAEVALQIGSALAYAHTAGVIHRDLKPANLFLSDDGRVKLGDFGIARDEDRSRLTSEGLTVGSYFYMAPEQIAGEKNIAAQLDLYALGCVLFEMLAGRPPFMGNSIPQIFEQHFKASPPDLRSISPDCPPALIELVNHLLRKQPHDRPASATNVRERLKEILAISEALPTSTHSANPLQTQQVISKDLVEQLTAAASGNSISWRSLGMLATAVAGGVGVALYVMKSQ